MEIEVLGPLRLLVDGEPVVVAAPKQRAVLAVLALRTGHAVSTEELIDTLWGDAPPASARKTLQGYVARLRKVLGEAVLVTEPPGYALAVPRESVDALRFETLASEGRRVLHADEPARASTLFTEALSLWRGEPLVDLQDTEIARAEAVRLEELHFRLTEDRADAELALGNHETLVPALEALVTEHPYREGLWARLMLALYRCGRQRDALLAYQRARSLFVEELGIEPGTELQDMERRILAQEPALDAGVAPTRLAAAPALPKGAVTFLFTDIEGSTRRWQEDASMPTVLARHDELLRGAIESCEGHWVKHTADGVLAVFASAPPAAEAAVEAQRAVERADWGEQPLRVRMGLHTGEGILRGDDYVGYDVHRASRVCDAGHGGQILVSEATAELVRDSLPEEATLDDLGIHRLKGLAEPVRLFTVEAPDLPGGFPPLWTLEAVANNVPVHRSAFIGREGEIARVRRLLEEHALVTLTGIGGCGKTRLALQVGAEELDRFPDGVFFVDLAPLADPDLVAQTTADAMSLQLWGGRPAADLLIDALARRRCLLVVDNCEHLLDACAELVDRILLSCPDVGVLATSREPLGVEAEQVSRVPSLSLPDEGSGAPSEAVDLFIERAKSADPDFELTPDDHQAVTAICRRLDGIPLAIEFAAARVSHLSPQRIAERLDDRFRLLTGGRRRIRRQQTLEAALDWSHDLLDETGQLLLRRLAVFAASFPLEMAEEVCPGEGVDQAVVVDLLGSLVDRSLVVTEPADGDLRYRLLETVRSYAEAKLEGAGEAEAFRSRHRDAYLGWLESMSWDDLYLDTDVVAALVREHDNLREAMAWSQAQARRDLVGRLAARAAVLWQTEGGGHGEEGRRWLTWALEDPEGLDPAEQAACFVGLTAASLTFVEPEMEEHAARAMELGRGVLGGPIVQAAGIRAVAAAGRAAGTGDPGADREARALADEGVWVAEELGGDWPALALYWHGETVLVLGDVEAAERSFAAADAAASGRAFPLYEAVCAELAACRLLLGDAHGALDAAGRMDHTTPTRAGASFTSLPAALAEVRLGRPSDAAANLRAGIGLAQSMGIFLVPNYCLLYAGALAYETGDAPTASRLLAAAVNVGDAREASMPFRTPGSFAVHRHYARLAHEALDPEEEWRCRDEGEAMTEDEALADALELTEMLQEQTVGQEA